MGVLFDQAERLLREKWASVQLLAEELFAIFRQQDATNIDTPVKVQPGPGVTLPAITINTTDTGGSQIVFNKGGCTNTIDTNDQCQLTLNGKPISTEPGGGGGTGTGNPFGIISMACQVISGGPGNPYTVQIVGAAAQVTAVAPGLDANETIPPFATSGQEYPLFGLPGGVDTQGNTIFTYVFLVPLWL